ncbi:Pre-mRNA-splicing factor CWC22 [Portunus trituberculatus]|uniref:Pre-mRNA-splicing factor CWC22 n=1 Tax=Portunus trituberculatus TaxID=210409 RepID=A0A5B7D9H0_PORTR|nr:Pre-mRNA-splicing factor CWC22 [Portunus trituberculatus]
MFRDSEELECWMGSRSRTRSPASDRDRSHGRHRERERSSRHHHKSRHHKSSKGRSRDRSRERSVSRDRHRRERSKSRNRSDQHHSREDRHSRKREKDSGSRHRDHSSSEDDYRSKRKSHKERETTKRSRKTSENASARDHSSSEDEYKSRRKSHKERDSDKRSRKTSERASDDESLEKNNTSTGKQRPSETPDVSRKDDEHAKVIKDTKDLKDKTHTSKHDRKSEEKDVRENRTPQKEKPPKESAEKEHKRKDTAEKELKGKDAAEKSEKPTESKSSKSEESKEIRSEKKKREESLEKQTEGSESKERPEKTSEKKVEEKVPESKKKDEDEEEEEKKKSDSEKQEKHEKKSSKRKSEAEEQKKKHKKQKHKKHSSSSESEEESGEDSTEKKTQYDSDETTEQELLRKKRQLEEQLQIEEEIQQRTKAIEKEREAIRAKKLKSTINSEVIKPAEKEKSPNSRSRSRSPEKSEECKQTRDERSSRGDKRSRNYSSDEGEEPQIGARYWGGDATKETSQAQKSKAFKTSDTYWNKYADKLGIQIEDPRNSDADYDRKKDRDRREDKRRDSSSDRPSRSEESSRKDGKRKGEGNEKNNVESSGKGPDPPAAPLIKKPVMDPLTTRTGGAYIPPARLKMMQAQITDKSSEVFQRLAWEALKKSINGLVNKVNVSNIGIIVRELLKENIVRGRGVLCRALMQAQAFSQTFTHVYAALVAIINTKFPQIGELLLKRLVIQLRRGVKKNDKNVCMSCCRFIAHLVNQQVAHEVVALEILTFLLERAKDFTTESEVAEKSRNDSCELAILFITECGEKLNEVSPRGMKIILETFRHILHEGKLETRVSYMLDVLFTVVKDEFKDHPAVAEELDLVEENEQFTHIVELDGKLDSQDILNVFKADSEYEANEEKYKEICGGILGEESGESEAESGSDSDDEASDEEDEEKKETETIIDQTETNMVAFRRTVYLTIQSSLDVDECAHKLLKGEIKPGWESELCNMILDCCAQQRTYAKFYGLLAQRFCMINKVYQEPFQQIFKDAYDTCHRLETEKLRNVTRLFAHLLFSDAISWEVLSHIHLNEDETASSSRVFIKILFQELAEFMGLAKLNERLRDPTLAHAFEGLLPRDNPRNTRFAINFFTSCGLGGLTDDLREFLRTQTLLFCESSTQIVVCEESEHSDSSVERF